MLSPRTTSFIIKHFLQKYETLMYFDLTRLYVSLTSCVGIIVIKQFTEISLFHI